MAGEHRSAASRARDVYRHPRGTLLFFGLRSDMTVVEIWPGPGGFTEILAPVLRERGCHDAAHFHVGEKKSPRYRGPPRQNFGKMLVGRPDPYEKMLLTVSDAPRQPQAAPADLVLTFRNVHNWTAAGSDAALFAASCDALKPGGILGVVEHRAREGSSLEQMIKSGYMTEAHVIALAERAGLRRVARSANP